MQNTIKNSFAKSNFSKTVSPLRENSINSNRSRNSSSHLSKKKRTFQSLKDSNIYMSSKIDEAIKKKLGEIKLFETNVRLQKKISLRPIVKNVLIQPKKPTYYQ